VIVLRERERETGTQSTGEGEWVVGGIHGEDRRRNNTYYKGQRSITTMLIYDSCT